LSRQPSSGFVLHDGLQGVDGVGDQLRRPVDVRDGHLQEAIAPHWREIDPAVSSLLRDLATAKSAYSQNRLIYYGVINGSDSNRLLKAYPEHFSDDGGSRKKRRLGSRKR
jgi:hypothetical protein